MNKFDLSAKATRLVTELRAARKLYEEQIEKEEIRGHYLGAARAMLDDDKDTPRFYRACVAVAIEQDDPQLAKEIQRVADNAENRFARRALFGISPKDFMP